MGKTITKKTPLKQLDKSRNGVIKTSRSNPPEMIQKELIYKMLEEEIEWARIERVENPDYQTPPRKCTPELLNQIIEKMAEGKTIDTASVECGIAPATLKQWKNSKGRYFDEAVTYALNIAEKLQTSWWDEMGRRNLKNKEFNATLYMMMRQNLHGWSRRIDGKITTHNIDEQIKRNITEVKIISDESISEIARILVESGAIESEIKGITDTEIN